jgi:hypothetical protein
MSRVLSEEVRRNPEQGLFDLMCCQLGVVSQM